MSIEEITFLKKHVPSFLEGRVRKLKSNLRVFKKLLAHESAKVGTSAKLEELEFRIHLTQVELEYLENRITDRKVSYSGGGSVDTHIGLIVHLAKEADRYAVNGERSKMLRIYKLKKRVENLENLFYKFNNPKASETPSKVFDIFPKSKREKLAWKFIMNFLKKEKLLSEKSDQEQLQQLDLLEWLEYFKDETLMKFKHKIFFINGLLRSYEGNNSDWFIRGERYREQSYPKFDSDKANRVLPIISDLLDSKKDSSLIDSLNLTEEDLERISKLIESRNFAPLFNFIEKKSSPNEYEDLQENYSVQVFEGNILGDATIKERSKEVADLCQKSKSFCIRGQGMAQQYLEHGDLYILTREGTNKKTKKMEKSIPQIAIYIQGGYINEIKGNEVGQDFNVHDAQFILNVLNGRDKTLDTYPHLRRAIIHFFSKEENYIKLENVIRLETIKNKVRDEFEMSIEELKWLYGLGGSMKTFVNNRNEINSSIEMIKNQRSMEEDFATMFKCHQSEVLIDTKRRIMFSDMRDKRVLVGNVTLTGELGDALLPNDLESLVDGLTIVGKLEMHVLLKDRKKILKTIQDKKIRIINLADPEARGQVNFIFVDYIN